MDYFFDAHGRLQSDIDFDGQVDAEDWYYVNANYNSIFVGATHADGDVDFDGDVDSSDVVQFYSQSGMPAPNRPTSITFGMRSSFSTSLNSTTFDSSESSSSPPNLKVDEKSILDYDNDGLANERKRRN